MEDESENIAAFRSMKHADRLEVMSITVEWLLAGECEASYQAEFNALALVPIPWSNVSRR